MRLEGYGGWERLRPWRGMRVFVRGACSVLIRRDWIEEQGGKECWHLSISCTDRYPTWDEIRDARYALLPGDVTMAMLLPPVAEYVNVHENCFHLWEIDG